MNKIKLFVFIGLLATICTPVAAKYKPSKIYTPLVWGTPEGKSVNSDKGSFRLSTAGADSVLLAESVPAMYNSVVEFDVCPNNSSSQFGILVRYVNDKDWTYVGCDLTTDILGNCHWYVVSPKGKKVVAVDIAKLYKNYTRHVSISCEDNTVSIYVDGEKITRQYTSFMGANPGKTGFRAHGAADAVISDVKIHSLKETTALAADKTPVLLSSDKLEVALSRRFPAVLNYTHIPSGEKLEGASEIMPLVTINGLRYSPKVSLLGSSANSAEYSLSFEGIGVEARVTYEVNAEELTMRVNEIKENGSFKVTSIGFSDNPCIAMFNNAEGAKLSVANNVSSDNFYDLASMVKDSVCNPRAIAILNNNKVAVTIDNNSAYNCKQVIYNNSGTKTSLCNNEWIYRGIDGGLLPLPVSSVIFTSDSNRDGKTDWQDAAVILADKFEEPFGVDKVRNSYVTITMNFASGGQYPFMRQLDNVKKFYLATDGFSQMLLLKGYQSEGHDSGHPDYAGSYNNRAGGLEDLQKLCSMAKDYDALIGVHINHSESYPEAKAYNDRIVTDIPGWRWLDQAYLINKEADVVDGTFRKRVDDMKRDLPDLGFVYVDTYREHRYLAAMTAAMFKNNNWLTFTEDSEIFYREGAWIHYNPECKSDISRFVQHTLRDGYAKHPLLLGGYDRGASIGFMGWQKGRDFNGVLHNFYTQQLPYRYLMNFKIRKMDDSCVEFENGVVSRLADDNKIEISRNSRIVMHGDNVFIPWSALGEDKIYHYNSDGGVSEWQLPESWSGVSSVKLYRLGSHGREFIKDLDVSESSKVAITAEPRTGYVVYRNEPAAIKNTQWGEGTPVINPGFDGEITNGWKPLGNTKIATTLYGQDFLQITGSGSASQKINSLEKGATYAVSVWCEIDSLGEAALSLGDVKYSVKDATVKNFTDNTDKYGTRYQRIKLYYTHLTDIAPSLELSFKSNSGDCKAAFDDVRIVKCKQSHKLEKGVLYFEDFEDVDEGWGAFTASKPSAYTTHLSEKHDGYTFDTIDGQFSFKTWNEGDGDVYRTTTSSLQFKPNATYEISFDYLSTTDDVYTIVVRSEKDGKEVFNKPLNKAGKLLGKFSTFDAQDYYITVTKNGNGILVLDNILIKEGR